MVRHIRITLQNRVKKKIKYVDSGSRPEMIIGYLAFSSLIAAPRSLKRIR